MSKPIRFQVFALLVALAVLALGVLLLPRDSAAQSGATMNGHAVAADFLAYWQAHGGLAINGYPITDEAIEVSQTDGKSYATQWFERARYERHPENPPASRVLLGLLGVEYTKGMSFAPASSQVSNATTVYFAATNHSLSNNGAPFLSYWKAGGGLAQFGYPLSEQLQEVSTDGKTYTVQYFERQRFEYHPEQSNPQYRVLLGLLGVQLYQQRNATPTPGQSGSPPTDTPAPAPTVPQGTRPTPTYGGGYGGGGGYP
jgi:hypothetical protein